MALFSAPIFLLPFTILLTCFAIQSKSIPTVKEGEVTKAAESSSTLADPNPTFNSLFKTSGASIEKGDRNSQVSSTLPPDRQLTEEELSRNGTIRNRLFGFNFDLNLGGRQSLFSFPSSYSMTTYHQAIVTAYCRNLLSAISNARLPPTPPVAVSDPVVTIPPTLTSRPTRNGSTSPSNLPPATEEEENLQIQSRTLRCLRTSSLFRSTDPYSMVLNMCTTIVTTGRYNYM